VTQAKRPPENPGRFTLYHEWKLSVAAIAQKLHLSKSTLYSYRQHRGVEIGPFKKSARQLSSVSASKRG
jgi:hypothetical protein